MSNTSRELMIAIIDYGMGNLRSVQKAFEVVGHETVVTRAPQAINDASHVVLPGVGAFADCMANLERYGLANRSTARSRPANHSWVSVSGSSCCSARARSSASTR